MRNAPLRGLGRRFLCCFLVVALFAQAPALALTALPSSSASGALSGVCAPLGVRNVGLENAHLGISAFLVRFALLRCAGEAWNHALSRACVYGGPPWFVVCRYYDPATGRYLQPDPLDADVNPYAYAGGNPLSFVDPEGTCLARLGTDAYLIAGAVASLLSGGTLPALALAAYGIYAGLSDISDAMTKQRSFEDSVKGIAEGFVENYLMGKALGGAGKAYRWAKGKLGDVLANGGAGVAGVLRGGGARGAGAGGAGGGGGGAGGGAGPPHPDRLDHIFRNAKKGGHWNPRYDSSRQRLTRYGQAITADKMNQRTDWDLSDEARAEGVTVYAKVAKSGKQVWVYVRDRHVIDMGYNLPGKHR